MMENNSDGEAGVRSTTPEVEPPVVEALTPPSTADVKGGGGGKMELGDELAGLDNLDPEIVALLKADMGLNKNNSRNFKQEIVKGNEDDDGYAP